MNSSFTNFSIGSQFRDFTWDDLTPAYQNLNNANYWAGFAFWLDEDKSVSEVMSYFLKTGTLAAGDSRVDIYDVLSNGNPDIAGGSLGNTTTCDSAIYASGWQTYTFSPAVALTGGKYYCFLWKNLNATPASNYLRFSRLLAYQLSGDGLGIVDLGFKYTSNAGTSWTRAGNTARWRVKFSDDSYIGFPAIYGVNVALGQLPIPPTSGIVPGFLTPDFKIKLNQVQIALDRIGTITSGDLGCYLYNDGGLVATSLNQIDMLQISLTPYEYHFLFDNIELEKNTRYYLVPFYINKVNTGYITVVAGQSKDDATSMALIRNVMGLDVRTYNYGGSVFSETTTGSAPYYVIPLRLWGNIDEPIVPEDGGASPFAIAYA